MSLVIGPLKTFARMDCRLLLIGLCMILPVSPQRHVGIAGGQNAKKGQFPWLVSIEATNFQQSWPLCDGILITEEWVLTAAHCLDSEKPEWLWVVTGQYDTTKDEGTEQRINVSSITKHPDYTYWQKPYKNDVGLVHLKSKARIDDYTKLAPLPNKGIDDYSGLCQVAGWGITQEGGKAATILQYASVPLNDGKTCDEAYNSEADANALCVGDVRGGSGACIGDNGGGLYCWSKKSNQYVIGGVMSWRDGCALPGKPAVYMDVAPYRDWINSAINS